MIEKRLRELQHDDGRIDPKEVVDDARDENSPLHPCFEWDDTVAAERDRLRQARLLIRSVKIDLVINKVSLRTPVYVRDPDEKPVVYRTVTAIRTEEDQAREVMLDEMRRISNAINRAKILALVFGLEDEFTNIQALVQTIVARTQHQSEGRA